MRKKISIGFLIVGMSLIIYGAYNFFERYDEYLINENGKSSLQKYDGSYNYEGEIIMVRAVSDEQLNVLIDNATYKFNLNGDFFENKEIDYTIRFEGNELIILKSDELESKSFIKNN